MTTDEQPSRGPDVALRETIAQRWGHLTADDLRALESDVHALVDRIQEKTGEGRDAIARFLLHSAASARQSGERLTEDARRAARELRERYDHAEELVRTNPTQAVAAAFGVGVVAGLVLGAALRRR